MPDEPPILPPPEGFKRYQVGEIVPGWPGPQGEGGRFNFTKHGCVLTLFYANPRPREIEGLRHSPMRVGLLEAGRHTWFFLYSIPHTTNGWSDASFALGLNPPDLRVYKRENPKEAWTLLTLLVDASTGVLRAARFSTLTPFFCTIMEGLVDKQRAALADFTPTRHREEHEMAYLRWPRPQLMIEDALIWERLGIPFERL